MIELLRRLFTTAAPVLSEASVHDAAAIATLHAASFRRGWGDTEVESLLLDSAVETHLARAHRRLAGFIMSRIAAGEAEILSVAVARAWRGRGVAGNMLRLHLGRLAGLGVGTVFLEVDEANIAAIRLYQRSGFHQIARRPNYYPGPDAERAAALVFRRDLG
jgi:ribosomal-protein-alanine N-acetyltransferase